jgi:hypothetical protein
MLGFSPLASAPLAADSDRVRADLEARLAGAINLSGSAHANASVRSEGAAVLDLAAISSGFSANSAAINGASNVSGSASAKVKLNSSASTTLCITGDGVASARLKARSVSFWDAGGLSRAGVATRAALSEEFVLARAASADVETLGDVSTSILFVLNAAVLSVGKASAIGNLALTGSAVSAAVIKLVLVTSVAFDGQGTAGVTPAAGFDDQATIFGNAAAHAASLAVSAGGIEAAVGSSAALLTRANADGGLQIAGPIRTTADVAARADSQILPRGSSVGTSTCRLSASGLVTLRAMGSGGVSGEGTAAGTFVALAGSEASVSVDVLSARVVGLIGSSVGRVANAAGIAGTGDLSGLAASVLNTDASAQPVLGLQGHSRGALASSVWTNGHLRAVSIIHAAASGVADAAGEIGISGTAATMVVVAVELDEALAPAGATRATSTINATSQFEAIVQPDAQVGTGNAAVAHASLTITGVISGTSQAPLFAQAASGVLIGGLAKIDAAVSGASQVGSAADLVGASDGRGGILGAGVSTVDVALNFAGATVLPAAAASDVAVGGDASASVGQLVMAAALLSTVGTSAVQLPISATVQDKFSVEGDTACFCGVTVSAHGEITVTRTLITDVAILADAARAVDLNGQGAAQVASGVTSAIASVTVSGTTTAAALAFGDADAAMGLSGKVAAEAYAASEVSGAVEIGLTASVTAPRLAVFGAILAVGSSAVAITDVASAAFGDLSKMGTAITAVPLHAKASSAIAFTRDAAAAALIDATSARSITFLLDAEATVYLVAGSIGQAPYHVVASAAVTGRAETADALDLAGVVDAQGGVKASGASAINVAGTSVSGVAVGSDSLGDFIIASAGEADVGIVAVSTRSVSLAGDAAATVRLLADAIGGRLDLGVTVAAFSDARADTSGAISLVGLGRGNIKARAQADSVFVVTRSGAGDVSIVGQSDHVVTFLGHASVATATTAAANTAVPLTATASTVARLISAVERATFSTSQNSAAFIDIDASAQRAQWPISVRSIAFLAPPSQRRGAFVSAKQGGHVLSKPQSGGIIPARITSAA